MDCEGWCCRWQLLTEGEKKTTKKKLPHQQFIEFSHELQSAHYICECVVLLHHRCTAVCYSA